MKRFLVTDTFGARIIVEGEETPSGAAYEAADKHGMGSPTLYVIELGEETFTFQRGWVKKSEPINR